MKKMIFGALLFFGGLIGVLALVIVSAIMSAFSPWDYNGITGIMGYMLGTRIIYLFISFCIMGLIGIVICAYEAYR